jgi:DNA mismatch repair protein MutH
MSRPYINDIMEIFRSKIKGQKYNWPKTKNKGKVGILLENLLGIPNSSACLDCEDGELKSFQLKKLICKSKFGNKGDYVPKETVAITMIKTSDLQTTSFENSRLNKKIKRICFIPYIRHDDDIIFIDCYLFDHSNSLQDEILSDYIDIQKYYNENKITKGKIGKLIQIRTKGAGGEAPKSHAFYFRKDCLAKICDPIKILA